MLHKFKFYGSVAIVYALTFGTIGALFFSSQMFGATADATHVNNVAYVQQLMPQRAVSGTPTRITIPSYGIDLPIDIGDYNANTKQWTLSETHAHYAKMTAPANDRTGTTFIYGHGTDAVFGKIGTNPPPAGTIARVHANNGRTFVYTLKDITNLKPNQTHIFKNTSAGSPQLVIQTCTGAFSEWRTMFTFSFKEVE